MSNDRSLDMFNVIDIESATPILDEEGNVRVFDNIEDALVTMRGLFAITGKKYKPKQVIDSSWHIREQSKYDNGEYKLPFWHDKYFHCYIDVNTHTGNKSIKWAQSNDRIETDDLFGLELIHKNIKIDLNPHHYVHVSKLDASKIAYTENEDKGMNDRQTQMNVARYLIQHCNVNPDLANYIDMLHKKEYQDYQIHFESNGDKIVKLYQNGPNTCMSKEAHRYDSYCHPVLVYDNSDISLAYTLNDEDRVSARVLVWQDKKLYSRFYGDYEKLKKQLDILGYSSDNTFHGAKIKRIEDEDKRNRLVLPYLDGCNTVSILDSKWLMIDESGDIEANTTNGLQRKITKYYCESCEYEIEDEDDLNTVYISRNNTASWCNYCRRNEATECERTGDYIANDEIIEVDNRWYARWLVEDEANYCQHDEEYTFNDLIEVYISEDNSEYWNDRYEDETFICRIDGKRYVTKLIANDSWIEEPRAIFNIPNDRPENCNDNIAYRCYSWKQYGLLI